MLDISIAPVTVDILSAAALIFCLRVADVSLGTLRLIMIAHGHRNIAGILGFVEITIWIVAISNVVTNLGNFWMILGYSGGYATGTMLGMWMEEKMAIGNVVVNIVSSGEGEKIARRLRDHGSRVMEYQGAEENGAVNILSAITSRKKLPLTLKEIQFIDSNALVTVEDLRMAKIPTTPVR